VAEHHRCPGLCALAYYGPCGLGCFIAFQQDLQGIEQPGIDDANQLIDEVSSDGRFLSSPLDADCQVLGTGRQVPEREGIPRRHSRVPPAHRGWQPIRGPYSGGTRGTPPGPGPIS
jgi:hypothetical protein